MRSKMDLKRSSNYQKYAQSGFARIGIRHFLNSLARILNCYSPACLMDAGCGEGFVIRHLRSSCPAISSYVGVDSSVNALKYAYELNPQERFLNGSLLNLPFRTGAFNAVICLEVLEHLENIDAALSELRRVANDFCVFSVPHEPFFSICRFLGGKDMLQFGKHPEHVHFFSPQSFQKKVASYFTVEKISFSFPWMIVVCRIK